MNDIQLKTVSLLSVLRNKGILDFQTSEDTLQIHSGKNIVTAVFGDNYLEVFSSASNKKVLSGDFSLEKAFRLINEEIACSNVTKMVPEVSKAFPNLKFLFSAVFYPISITEKSVYYKNADGMIFQHKEDPEVSLGIFEELYKRNAEDQMLILDGFDVSRGSSVPACQILNRRFTTSSLQSLIKKVVPLVSERQALDMGYPNKILLSKTVLNLMPDLDYIDEVMWNGFYDEWLFSCKKENTEKNLIIASMLDSTKWLAFSNEKLYNSLAKIRSSLNSLSNVSVCIENDDEYRPLSSSFGTNSMLLSVVYSKTDIKGDYYRIQQDLKIATSADARADGLRSVMSKAGISRLVPGKYIVLVSGNERIKRIQNNVALTSMKWETLTSSAVLKSFKKSISKGILVKSSEGANKYTPVFQAKTPKGVDFQIKSEVIDLTKQPEDFVKGFNSRYASEEIGSSKRLVLNSTQIKNVSIAGEAVTSSASLRQIKSSKKLSVSPLLKILSQKGKKVLTLTSGKVIKSEYHGWSNYETWAVALWLDNDQGSQEMVKEWANEAIGHNPEELVDENTRSDAEIKLADMIKDYLEEFNPLAEQEASVYGDLLNAALGEIDYFEIAKNVLDEIANG